MHIFGAICHTWRGTQKAKGLMPYPSPITILAPKTTHYMGATFKAFYGSKSKSIRQKEKPTEVG